MYKLLITIFLFTLNISSYSQDNLKSFEESINEMSIDEISRLSYKYLYYKQHKSKVDAIVRVVLNKLKKREIKDEDLTKSYRILYLNAYHIGDYKKTIIYGSLSETTAKQVGNRQNECLANIILGQSYFEEGDYDRAIHYHLKSLKIASQYNIEKLEIACKANIGKLKLACDDFSGAIKILKSSIQEIENSQIIYLKANYPEIYSDLTLSYIKVNNLEKASFYNELGKENAIKYKYYLSENRTNEAILEMYKKNYNHALQIIDSIYTIDEKNVDKLKLKASLHLVKGEIYFRKKEFQKALKELLALEKLENQKKINHLEFQKGYSILAKTYTFLDQRKLALKYYKKALSTFTESEKNKIKLIAEISNKYDENEINQILKNKDLANTEFIHKKYSLIKKEIGKLNSEKQQQNNILIVISSILIGISIIVYYFLNTSRKRNKEKMELLLTRISEIESEKTTLKKKKTNYSLNLKDSEIKRILDSLIKLEEENFFLNTDCTVSKISKELKTNTTYLSKIINSHYQKTFTNYINELRIHYVIKRLQTDKLFRRYSIQSIANEIGFKSRESFNKTFKKETGILPSYFIKELNKEK